MSPKNVENLPKSTNLEDMIIDIRLVVGVHRTEPSTIKGILGMLECVSSNTCVYV